MQNHKKITQEQPLSDAQHSCLANAVIELHALTVCTSQQFYLSKKFKKLAYSLANEIASLEPKPLSNLKIC